MDVLTLDRNIKRRFFSLIVSAGLPFILVFFITDYIEGDIIELAVDAVIGLILLVSFIAVRKTDADLLIFRIFITLISLAFLYGVSIGSGKETILYWVIILPMVFMFFFGAKEGATWVLIFFFILCVLIFNPLSLDLYNYPIAKSFRYLVAFLFLSIFTFGFESSRYRFRETLIKEHNELVRERDKLEEALEEIKTLQGIVPICSFCKKIRDDEGYWSQVENYVTEHTHAEFSHSICPDCAKKHYQGLY